MTMNATGTTATGTTTTGTTSTGTTSTGSTTSTGTGTVPLGSSGLGVFPLCLGGNVFGWTADEETSRDVLDAFTRAGGNLVDTADVYSRWVPGHTGGESETIIGRWLADGHGDGVRIATKTGGLPDAELTRSEVHRALDASLARLQRDTVDLYYAHRDQESRPVAEIVDAFASTVTDGRARAWAVSNWSAERITAAVAAARDAGVPAPVAVQNRGNAVMPTDADVSAAAREAGMLELPYSTLASGFLSGKYSREGDLPDSPRASGVRETLMTDHGWAVLDAVRGVARERGVAVGAVALAWLRSRGAVPIASARSVGQLPDLLAAVRLELSADEGGGDLRRRRVSGVTTQAEVSVIPATCVSCRGEIGAGERFLRHTDRRAATPVRFAECAACARRAGRGDLLELPHH